MHQAPQGSVSPSVYNTPGTLYQTPADTSIAQVPAREPTPAGFSYSQPPNPRRLAQAFTPPVLSPISQDLSARSVAPHSTSTPLSLQSLQTLAEQHSQLPGPVSLLHTPDSSSSSLLPAASMLSLGGLHFVGGGGTGTMGFVAVQQGPAQQCCASHCWLEAGLGGLGCGTP